MTTLSNWIHDYWPQILVIESPIKNFKLPPENDYSGNVEYKRTLVDCTSNRIQKYITQMKWRALQSLKQQAIYYVGIDDDGSFFGLNFEETKTSISTFMEMVFNINATVTKIHLMSIDLQYVVQIKIQMKESHQTFYNL
jgi:elongation factor 1-alpha